MTLKFGRENLAPELLVRLQQLEGRLAPKNSLETVRAYVLSDRWSDWIEETDDDGQTSVSRLQNASERTVTLVKEVAFDDVAFHTLLDEAVSAKGGRIFEFGQGAALGVDDPLAGWTALRAAYAATAEGVRNDGVACGYIRGIRERCGRETVHEVLDDAVDDPIFGPMYPRIQIIVDLEERDGLRLLRSLNAGIAPTWMYRYLGMGRSVDPLPPTTLCQIISMIFDRPDGQRDAIDILGMRYFSAKDGRGEPLDEELIAIGGELLCKLSFTDDLARESHHLADIAKVCLSGDDKQAVTRRVCLRYAQALCDYRTSAYAFGEFAVALFEVQPRVAIDAFLLPEDANLGFRTVNDFHPVRLRPLDVVPDDIILEWAEVDLEERVPALGAQIAFQSNENGARTNWTSLALRLLDVAPNKTKFLKSLEDRIHPRSWSGSLADRLEERRPLITDMLDHSDSEVRAWAGNVGRNLSEIIAAERAREQERDESFE